MIKGSVAPAILAIALIKAMEPAATEPLARYSVVTAQNTGVTAQLSATEAINKRYVAVIPV
jgi:hypothetical protein